MKIAQSTRPQPGQRVILIAVPPGMLDDLSPEDQRAIKEAVGKTVLLNGYDEAGRAELEFRDASAAYRFLYVRPEFIRKAAS
jgi:hypothetical protein